MTQPAFPAVAGNCLRLHGEHPHAPFSAGLCGGRPEHGPRRALPWARRRRVTSRRLTRGGPSYVFKPR